MVLILRFRQVLRNKRGLFNESETVVDNVNGREDILAQVILVCLHFSSILVILAQKPRSLSGFGSYRSEPDWGIQFES